MAQTGERIADPPLDLIGKWFHAMMDDPYYNSRHFIGKWEMSKLTRASWDKEKSPYLHLRKRVVRDTSWVDVVSDNWHRFTALAFLDRIVTVRQSSLFSSNLAYTGKNNLTASINAIRNQGFFQGALRGNFLNYIHFLGVQAQAYIISNGNLTSFLSALLVLETALYPLDTARVRYQADISGRYSSFLDCLNRTKPAEFYSGLPNKLIFAAIYGFYLTQAGNTYGFCNWVNLPLLAIAYPFLTLKTIGQVTLTSGNIGSNIAGSFSVAEKLFKGDGIRVLYRGFLPFVALSWFAPHFMPKIWAKEIQESTLDALYPHFESRKSSWI